MRLRSDCSICAVVRREAVWRSCPQACMTPSCCDRGECEDSSRMGRASMSARSAMVGPGSCPWIMATHPAPRAYPVLTGMPRFRSFEAMYSPVWCSWKESSAWV